MGSGATLTVRLCANEITSIDLAFLAVSAEAAGLGLEMAGSEIIGLLPEQALLQAAAGLLNLENFRPGIVLEKRLQETGSEVPRRPEPRTRFLMDARLAVGRKAGSTQRTAPARALPYRLAVAFKRRQTGEPL
jgi:hypothetical protein